MFELAGTDEETARRALKLAAYKLPIKCKVVSREESRVGSEKYANAAVQGASGQADAPVVEMEGEGSEV
jgi:hypothetical protein